ncbi:MAG: LysR family transcriptional regulator [Pseudomonadota bacterium]
MTQALDRLTLLQTFVRIVDAGSISAAARDLGLSQPSASRQLAQLEARLNAQLLRRTTHALSLTEAGSALLADARVLLDGWDVLEERHGTATGQVRGTLSVVAPVALGQTHLVDFVAAFQRDFPVVALNWQLNDEPIRFAEAGCDCWIRVGPVPDERLVVRRLGRVERLLVASSGLLAEHGVPATPTQAGRLPLLALAPFDGGTVTLSRPGRSPVTLSPEVRVRTNNIFAIKQAALADLGLAVLPTWLIARELAAGELVAVPAGYRAPSLDLHVAYPSGRHTPLRLRRFLERLAEAVPAISGIDAVA